MNVVSPLALAALSLAVLLLVLAHRRANLGGGPMLVFVLAATGYGCVRSIAIRALSEARLGSAPYRLETPLLSVAGVPLQELFGWISAVGLAGYLADRLLRRLLGSANAWVTALAAGLGMAAVCLAVETAAVTAGWWSWSLAHTTTGALRFPAIALLDWGFVAIDFLLPFELWRRRAPLPHRIAGLLLFPLHLAGHALTSPVWEGLPLSGFDIVHVGLVAAVAAAAMRYRDVSPWPATAAESWRLAPLLAVAVLLGTTSMQLLLLGEAALLWSGFPLALAAAGAYALRVEAPRRSGPLRSAAIAGGLFAGLVLVGLLMLLPARIRTRDFERELGQGISALSARDLATARGHLAAALRIRPSHPDAAWLLGWCEMQAGRRVEARPWLELAVARRLASADAVRFLALLDIQEGRRAEASALLARRRARHVETQDLAYLAWVADGGGAEQEAAPAGLLAAATEEEMRELFALARTLGDRPTLEACRALFENRRRDAASAAAPSG